MMKIAHVITGLSDGGAEAVLFPLVSHDARDAHLVVSLTDEGKYGRLLRDRGTSVVALNMPRGRLTFKGIVRLWRTLRTWQPDVVQTWMYHADLVGGLVARLAGFTVVWGIRNITLEPGRSARTTIAVARACALLSRWVPRRIVACAHAAVVVHGALGYDTRRMVVIPNGYDLARFAPDPDARSRLRAEWGVADETPVIGMVARFDAQKDHDNLIRAFAQLTQERQDMRLALVGSGMTQDNHAVTERIEATEMQGRVWLLGPQTDVPTIMSALDIHVLSSAYGEAFPNVLAEAMACGTPCVATDVGDAAQILGETGWIVPPRNPQALSEALLVALTEWHDRAAWQARQRRCREWIVQRFGLERMVGQYRVVWDKAAKSQEDRHDL